jgi:hypothetical protein
METESHCGYITILLADLLILSVHSSFRLSNKADIAVVVLQMFIAVINEVSCIPYSFEYELISSELRDRRGTKT